MKDIIKRALAMLMVLAMIVQFGFSMQSMSAFAADDKPAAAEEIDSEKEAEEKNEDKKEAKEESKEEVKEESKEQEKEEDQQKEKASGSSESSASEEASKNEESKKDESASKESAEKEDEAAPEKKEESAEASTPDKSEKSSEAEEKKESNDSAQSAENSADNTGSKSDGSNDAGKSEVKSEASGSQESGSAANNAASGNQANEAASAPKSNSVQAPAAASNSVQAPAASNSNTQAPAASSNEEAKAPAASNNDAQAPAAVNNNRALAQAPAAGNTNAQEAAPEAEQPEEQTPVKPEPPKTITVVYHFYQMSSSGSYTEAKAVSRSVKAGGSTTKIAESTAKSYITNKTVTINGKSASFINTFKTASGGAPSFPLTMTYEQAADQLTEGSTVNVNLYAQYRSGATITLNFLEIRQTNGTITNSSTSNTLSWGSGWNITKTKLESTTGLRAGQSFSYAGNTYTYNGEWTDGSGNIINTSSSIQMKIGEGTSSGNIYYFTEDSQLNFYPVYDVTTIRGLDYYYIDNISTGSGSWSNRGSAGARSSFSQLTHTFSDPSDKTPVDHYRFVDWQNGENGDVYKAGESFEYTLDQNSTEDVTVKIYARWQPSVTVNYHGLDGEIAGSVEEFTAINAYEAFGAEDIEDTDFLGWFTEDGTKVAEGTVYDAPAITTTPVEQKVIDLYAKYSTSYIAEHLLENEDGEFTVKEAEIFTDAVIGSTAAAVEKTFEGYTFDSSIEGTLTEDIVRAGLVLRFFYTKDMVVPVIIDDPDEPAGDEEVIPAKGDEDVVPEEKPTPAADDKEVIPAEESKPAADDTEKTVVPASNDAEKAAAPEADDASKPQAPAAAETKEPAEPGVKASVSLAANEAEEAKSPVAEASATVRNNNNNKAGRPAAAGRTAANTEVIEDNEAPQAETATEGITALNGEETIDDSETPLAAPIGRWALINLIAMALTAIGALLAIFRRKEEEDEDNAEAVNADDEDREGMGRIRAAKLAGATAAIVSIVAFFITEDMSLPMALVDKWTILMIIIFAVQAVTAALVKKACESDEDEEAGEAEMSLEA